VAITTLDQLFASLASNASRWAIDKASLANFTAGQLASLWRATGTPAQAAIPTASAVPTSATLGALPFANQVDPNRSYLAYLWMQSSLSAMSPEVHDRVAHQGGLSLNVTTAQPIAGLDIGPTGLNLVAARRGAASFAEIQWYLEVYADGGATASNATVTVTYDDGSSNTLNPIAVGGTLRAGRLIPLTPFIPTAQQARTIRGVTNVTLSALTGTAGNVGFTATRAIAPLPLPLANKSEVLGWAELGAMQIPNDACLQLVMLTSATTTGALRGGGKIAHG
jgi:hypothetical protein